MNELIEHITKKVDEHFDDLSIEFSRQAWMEKFAELIVKECADICYNREYTDGSRYGDEIIEHFGVK